jgi:hypothetical protein
MTSFTLDAVRGFTLDLEARLTRCDNGEGMSCSTLESTLFHYAQLCWEFHQAIREWGQQVFAGKIAFDPEVEKVWLQEGRALQNRAEHLLSYGEQAEIGCYVLTGKSSLRATLSELDTLLKHWVTPSQAVGPAARKGFAISHEQSEAIRKTLDALTPLLPGWVPSEARQIQQFHRLRRQ